MNDLKTRPGSHRRGPSSAALGGSEPQGTLRWVVCALAGSALLAGVLTLVGWFTLTPRLTDWLNSGIHMFPNTAVAASTAALGLLLCLCRGSAVRSVATIMGGIVALLAGLTLSEHILGINYGIDTLLVTTDEWGFRAAAAPGRMGVPACVSFLLIGTGVILISRRIRLQAIPVIGISVMAIASLGLAGYAFKADPLFSVARLTGIAMQTAAVLLILGTAVLVSAPGQEPMRTLRERSAAGVLMRWALPFVIVLPVFLGWIFIVGRNQGWFDRGMGTALLVLALISMLCVLLWRCVAAVGAHERMSQAREARFRSYFDLGLVGMVITSPEKRIIEVNDEMCRMLGYGRGELAGVEWPRLTHPEDIAMDVAEFNRVLAGESSGYSLEKRFIRKDGKVTHALISIRCVRRPNGDIDHFVALVQDITERKRGEEMLRQRTRSLEIINRVGSSLAAELDLEKLVQAATDAGREVSGAQVGAFFYNVHNEKGEAYTLYTLSGVPREAFSKFPMPRNTAVFEPTFRGTGVMRVDDIQKDPRYGKNPPYNGMPAGHLPVRSYLAVPVISRSGESIGGLFYGHAEPGVFTEDAERIVVAIAAQAAVALDNARLYRKAQMEIAERKKAAEAKARLAAIVEHSDDAIISKDLNGVITSWNRSAERVFGYTAEEILGRSIFTLIPEDRHEEEPTILQRIGLGDTLMHYETVRRRKDGTLIDVSLTVSPVRDEEGRVIGVSKISRDITEKKRSERQQLALYELVATINRSPALPEIFEAAIDAVCRCHNAERAAILLADESGVMRFTAWRNLSDDYRRAVEGHSPWKSGEADSKPVYVDDVASSRLPASLQEALQREKIGALAFIPLLWEKRLLGKFMIYYESPRTFVADEMRPAQTIASQVVFAIERQKSGEALERLVNQRTASLREAIGQMEEFSYTVSHDLRAPLRGMKVYAETLIEDYTQLLPEEAQRYLNRIAANADRLDKMILDVLTFSRLARLEFQLERVALDRLTRQIVEQYPGMQPPSAIIEIDSLPDVLGHEPSLTQALSNLLNNAVKFVAPNVQPRVRVWAESQHGHVRIWVADNGIGIDPRYQRRLFGMFERMHPNLPYDGTGVGLAIVRKAVERMGGRVGVESDGVTGSRFWIEVQAADNGVPTAVNGTALNLSPEDASANGTTHPSRVADDASQVTR